MSSFRETTIGDICESGGAEIQTGPFGSQLHAYDYVPVGTPVVPTEAIQGGKINHDGLPRISAPKVAQLSRHLLREGDILFARRGVQATGEIAYVGPGEAGFLCGTGAIRLRISATNNIVRADYLAHVLRQPTSRAWLRQQAIGATMPNLNETIIRRFPLHLPEISTQRRIADVLNVLDARLRLFTGENRTLEAMARALFRSWFVDFDPVRAKMEGRPTGLPPEVAALFPDRLVDSPLGEVPEGWEVGTLADIVVERREVVQPSAIEPTTRYIGLEHMPRGSIALGDYGRAEDVDSGKARFSAGDILFGKLRPYFKKVGAPGFAGICSTDILVATPKTPDWFAFALFHLSSQEVVDHADACSGGTRMPRVNWKDLVRYPIAIPPRTLAAEHNALTAPLVSCIQANLSQAETLAQLRDTLLPKLLSGEVRVPPNDSEEAVPA